MQTVIEAVDSVIKSNLEETILDTEKAMAEVSIARDYLAGGMRKPRTALLREVHNVLQNIRKYSAAEVISALLTDVHTEEVKRKGESTPSTSLEKVLQEVRSLEEDLQAYKDEAKKFDQLQTLVGMFVLDTKQAHGEDSKEFKTLMELVEKAKSEGLWFS